MFFLENQKSKQSADNVNKKVNKTADKKCKQIAENQGFEDSTVAKDFTKNNVFVWKFKKVNKQLKM